MAVRSNKATTSEVGGIIVSSKSQGPALSMDLWHEARDDERNGFQRYCVPTAKALLLSPQKLPAHVN